MVKVFLPNISLKRRKTRKIVSEDEKKLNKMRNFIDEVSMAEFLFNEKTGDEYELAMLKLAEAEFSLNLAVKEAKQNETKK
jgi:hypothetical protein